MTLTKITKTCPLCNTTKVIQVDLIAYSRWASGELKIQEAFPNLSPAEREELLTGYCAICWDVDFQREE